MSTLSWLTALTALPCASVIIFLTDCINDLDILSIADRNYENVWREYKTKILKVWLVNIADVMLM
jgi:hypothetical protein